MNLIKWLSIIINKCGKFRKMSHNKNWRSTKKEKMWGVGSNYWNAISMTDISMKLKKESEKEEILKKH